MIRGRRRASGERSKTLRCGCANAFFIAHCTRASPFAAARRSQKFPPLTLDRDPSDFFPFSVSFQPASFFLAFEAQRDIGCACLAPRLPYDLHILAPSSRQLLPVPVNSLAACRSDRNVKFRARNAVFMYVTRSWLSSVSEAVTNSPARCFDGFVPEGILWHSSRTMGDDG